MELVEPRSTFTTGVPNVMPLTLKTLWISSRLSGRGVLEDVDESVWNIEDPAADALACRGLALLIRTIPEIQNATRAWGDFNFC